MHKIDIYPEQSLVVSVFSGSVTIEEIKMANMKIARNSNFDKRFDGISDFRFAQANFTDNELREFRNSALKSDFTKGRWCLLVSTPLETAMSMIFANKIVKQSVRVFSTVNAASEYLGQDLAPLLSKPPSSTNSSLKSRIWRSTISSI